MNRFRSYHLILSVFLALFAVGCNTTAPEALKDKELSLQFNENQTFKIAQFTDIHWRNENEEQCA